MESEGINKFALLYQFNDSSPLFARTAEMELANNNVNLAIEILEHGIQKHPSYPTSYFIYARALAQLGRISEAKESVLTGAELIDSVETKKYYLKLIEKISSGSKNYTESRRTSFVSDDLKNLPKEDKSENLDELVEKIKTAKIPERDNKEIPEFKEPDNPSLGIVSDTLAMIYMKQKNYDEAIEVFEKLKKLKPHKAEEYQKKIDKIKDKLSSD